MLATVFLLLAGCHAGPSRREAAVALRKGLADADSTAVVRVWADGPPWFSCSEVTSKLRSAADHAVIRDAMLPWRTLVLADWIRLRDTSAGSVVEPGWCVASLRDSVARGLKGWRAVAGDTTPVGTARRGWDVDAGVRRIDVAHSPRLLGGDSAQVDYIVTIAPNDNGRALGVERDTSHAVAVISRVDGEWRLRR
jgi:hypothetical protein